MKPAPKKFTRQNPCTKQDIWDCFVVSNSYIVTISVQVDEAHSMIGVYTPREMMRAGRLQKIVWNGEDHYELTAEGMMWLKEWYDKKHNKV